MPPGRKSIAPMAATALPGSPSTAAVSFCPHAVESRMAAAAWSLAVSSSEKTETPRPETTMTRAREAKT